MAHWQFKPRVRLPAALPLPPRPRPRLLRPLPARERTLFGGAGGAPGTAGVRLREEGVPGDLTERVGGRLSTLSEEGASSIESTAVGGQYSRASTDTRQARPPGRYMIQNMIVCLS